MLFAFSSSIQGFNHHKIDKVCQDASAHFHNAEVAIAIVADGHGSDNYPRTNRGSSFAAEAAMTSILEFVNIISNNEDDLLQDSDKHLEQLEKRILAKWYEAVEEDLRFFPFSEDELENVSDRYKDFYLRGERLEKAYGTTLIAVCQTRSYWFGIQIGDGKCVSVLPNGSLLEPIPWDEQCQQNITTSICDSNAIEEFRHFFSASLPVAIFVGSDGIDDSYASDHELHELYRSILSIFAEQGSEIGVQEVQGYLPTISRKGSGDDVSISGILELPLSNAFINLLRAKAHLDATNTECANLNRIFALEEEEFDRISIEKGKLWASFSAIKRKGEDQQLRLDVARDNLDQALERRSLALLEYENAQKLLVFESQGNTPCDKFTEDDSPPGKQVSNVPDDTFDFFE